MVTGASTAQVAVILVDARKGLLTQTRRHSYLVSLVGIRHIVLAINKMDLIDFDEKRFESILRDYEQFAATLGFTSITAIPISALNGDNIIEASANTPWYKGSSLLNHLETVQIEAKSKEQPFRMPVQWVNRPHLDFRGFCGTIASGTIRPGDELQVASSGRTSTVARIVTMNGDLPEAIAGQAITLTLSDEIDVSRGDLLTAPDAPPLYTRHTEVNLVWFQDEPLKPGQSYLVKTAAALIPGRVAAVQYAVDVNTLEQKQVSTLGLNEIGVGRLELDRPLPFDPYRRNQDTGSFILIDRFTNATMAAGMFIAAAPEEAKPEQVAEYSGELDDGSAATFISLDDSFITGENLVDLTEKPENIMFNVSGDFLEYLSQGNRVLLQLRNVGQLAPLARLAYEHDLAFEFSRNMDQVNIILYKQIK
jgi:sulfate adenylyltransferase subunit 1